MANVLHRAGVPITDEHKTVLLELASFAMPFRLTDLLLRVGNSASPRVYRVLSALTEAGILRAVREGNSARYEPIWWQLESAASG